MTDRRLTPANGRVAALNLAGRVDAKKYLEGWPMMLDRPVNDLCVAPGGVRDRQLLLGMAVTVFEDHAGWSFVQTTDGYVGYVETARLAAPVAISHRVATAATHAYTRDDFKSEPVCALPFGACVQVLDERRKFYDTQIGFVPKSHLRALDRPFSDPATVAQIHFGVPYLWGGDSTRGIDCSGLIAASLRACDIDCPGDSDLQQDALGQDLIGPLARGDLIFWKGHVGMMVDEQTLLHANAHHMAARYEAIDKAILRIAAQGDGDVVARKRL